MDREKREEKIRRRRKGKKRKKKKRKMKENSSGVRLSPENFSVSPRDRVVDRPTWHCPDEPVPRREVPLLVVSTTEAIKSGKYR